MPRLYSPILSFALIFAAVTFLSLSSGLIQAEYYHHAPLPSPSPTPESSPLPPSALPVFELSPQLLTDLNPTSDPTSLDQIIPLLPPREISLHVNRQNQTLCLSAYGHPCSKAYPVSTGAYDTPTPAGEFQIYFKQPLRISGLDQPYRMPYYMAFAANGGYGLHALPYLGSNSSSSAFWHEARWHIGLPVSHGCIRLLPEDAAEIYSLIDAGTPLFIE